jgi:cytidylate kinase
VSGALAVPVIAIDGPTASGKGTVAERVAEALGFHCLDSGALYRIAGLLALESGVSLQDGDRLVALVQGLNPRFEPGRVWVGERDVAAAIRSDAAGQAASQVAAVPALRGALLDLQRRQRRAPGLVADGRDMGTVVFPDAALKVFLIADVRVRAERRFKQLIDKGYSAKLDILLRSLEERDARDQGRDCAPLVPAEDAHTLDSSQRSIDEVVDQVLRWFRAGPSASTA